MGGLAGAKFSTGGLPSPLQTSPCPKNPSFVWFSEVLLHFPLSSTTTTSMAFFCLGPSWDSNFRQGMALIWIKKLRSSEVTLGSLLSKLNSSPFNMIFYGLYPRGLVYPTVGKNWLIHLRVPAKPVVETNWWILPHCSAYPPMKNRWVFLRGPAKPAVESSWWNLLWGPTNPAVTTSLWMHLRHSVKLVAGEIRWILIRCSVKSTAESTWWIILRGPAKPAVETNWRIILRRPAKLAVEINSWIFMRRMAHQSAAYLGMELIRVNGPFVRYPVDGVVEDGRWRSYVFRVLVTQRSNMLQTSQEFAFWLQNVGVISRNVRIVLRCA